MNTETPGHRDQSANCEHDDHDDCAAMVECEADGHGLHDCGCACHTLTEAIANDLRLAALPPRDALDVDALIAELSESPLPGARYAVTVVRNWRSRTARAAQSEETPEPDYDPDYLCPNCVTPWKCNGPHIAQSEETPRPDSAQTDWGENRRAKQ